MLEALVFLSSETAPSPSAVLPGGVRLSQSLRQPLHKLNIRPPGQILFFI